MDKVYLECDETNIIFLDCTRLQGEEELVSRINANDLINVDKQVKMISNKLRQNKQTKIILADDVVFSGSVLRKIIDKFKSNGIEVIGVRACISTEESYNYFNNRLCLGLKCEYLMTNKVIDQICERDFYFGIVQSGISIKGNDGKIYKAPYFKPYGDPEKRASIPNEFVNLFSRGCLNRSIELWKKIEILSGKIIFMDDLPEKIICTQNEEVIKVLKKGRNYETNRNYGISC